MFQIPRKLKQLQVAIVDVISLTTFLLLFDNFASIQIGIIGLIEEEWLVTLATVDARDVTYYDFIETGTRLAAELRKQVINGVAHMLWFLVPLQMVMPFGM